MNDCERPRPFTHLHVTSGCSLRHGALVPAGWSSRLVEQAVAEGLDALARTDRDGLYGTVKFLRPRQEAGTSPTLGGSAVESPWLLPGKGSRRAPVIPTAPSRPSAGRSATWPHLHDLGRGPDPRPVVPERVEKSAGAEEAFRTDVDGPEEVGASCCGCPGGPVRGPDRPDDRPG